MRHIKRLEAICTICAVCIVLILTAFHVFSTPKQAIAGSAIPSVNSAAIGTEVNGSHTDPLVLFAGTTRTFYVNGTAADDDGYEDIDKVQVTLHRGALGASCSLDDNNCYRNLNCDLTNGRFGLIDYNCAIPVQYFADATDGGTYESQVWSAKVQAIDFSGNTSPVRGKNSEMASLVAASTVSSIDFGDLGLGETGASNQSIEVFNEGNRDIDIEASSDSDLSCEIGSIPRGNIKFDNQDASYASLSNSLSSTATLFNDIIPQQTDDSVKSSTVEYWNIKVPDVLVKGQCTGSVTLNAVVQ